MKSSHIVLGLSIVALCVSIGLLMAVIARPSATGDAPIDLQANEAISDGLSESELIASNREPPMVVSAAPALSSPPSDDVPMEIGAIVRFTPAEQRLVEESRELEALCRGGNGESADLACEE